MKELATRMRLRWEEIEGGLLARVSAIADPTEVADPEYVLGLRDAVGASLEYALCALEGEWQEVPPQLLAQARLAARNGVGLDTVLRRYSAGHTLVGDCLIEEAAAVRLSSKELKCALRTEAQIYDRIVAAISGEHARESGREPRDGAERHTETIGKLLRGDPVDATVLCYPLEGWHTGVVATGPGAGEGLRELAAALDRQLLLAQPEPDTTWAWLGGRRRASGAELARAAKEAWPQGCLAAAGEPGRGLAGWRLTHRQACAAMPVALRDPRGIVRYADVALLATLLRDELLASSLRQLYLAPLMSERDGGEGLRETLRAYLAAGGNVSSAAAALGVHRKTVAKRLRTTEQLIGRNLGSCLAELDAALRLEELRNP
jgi:PucR C-terminal helix-turn-helix domain/GGDEF-like domain